MLAGTYTLYSTYVHFIYVRCAPLGDSQAGINNDHAYLLLRGVIITVYFVASFLAGKLRGPSSCDDLQREMENR